MKFWLCWLNIFGHLLRLLGLGLRSKWSLAAENLFLRKQLTFYREKRIGGNDYGPQKFCDAQAAARAMKLYSCEVRSRRASHDMGRLIEKMATTLQPRRKGRSRIGNAWSSRGMRFASVLVRQPRRHSVSEMIFRQWDNPIHAIKP